MEYSLRIAAVLKALQTRLSLVEYHNLLKNIQSATKFEDLSKHDQQLIEAAE